MTFSVNSPVFCPFNQCSGNGYCTFRNERDMCICNEGYMLEDCSANTSKKCQVCLLIIYQADLPKLPSVFSSLKKKYKGDELFNDSTVAVVRLSINQTEFEWMLEPKNLYNDVYVEAQMWFNNQVFNEYLPSVGVHIHGSRTR